MVVDLKREFPAERFRRQLCHLPRGSRKRKGMRKIQRARLAGLAVAQGRLRLARIVVAVVAEIDDLAAELRLQPPRGDELRVKKPPWEKPARLLAETDDGGGAHARDRAGL